jgi:hypothetical protein
VVAVGIFALMKQRPALGAGVFSMANAVVLGALMKVVGIVLTSVTNAVMLYIGVQLSAIIARHCK